MTGYRTADATVSARDAVVVMPGDTDAADINVTRALYIGTTGDLKVVMASGRTVTFTAVAAGPLPVQVTRVFDTDTTADNILALY